MSAPLIRKFTATIGATNTLVTATDVETGLTFIRITQPNAILDVVNSPDPASTDQYVIHVWKNGVDTGRRLYSESMSAASAGRVRFQIGLSPGDYTFKVVQTAGTAADYGFIVMFARAP